MNFPQKQIKKNKIYKIVTKKKEEKKQEKIPATPIGKNKENRR